MALIGSNSEPFHCFLPILLHSLPIFITNAKIILRYRMTLIGTIVLLLLNSSPLLRHSHNNIQDYFAHQDDLEWPRHCTVPLLSPNSFPLLLQFYNNIQDYFVPQNVLDWKQK